MVTAAPVGNVTVQALVTATRAHLRALHLHSSISTLRVSQSANTSRRCGGSGVVEEEEGGWGGMSESGARIKNRRLFTFISRSSADVQPSSSIPAPACGVGAGGEA